MKQCPYCYEDIQDNAIKCKHCGSMLAERSRGSDSSAKPPSGKDTILPDFSNADTLRRSDTIQPYKKT